MAEVETCEPTSFEAPATEVVEEVPQDSRGVESEQLEFVGRWLWSF